MAAYIVEQFISEFTGGTITRFGLIIPNFLARKTL